jgi:hypothetical protein
MRLRPHHVCSTPGCPHLSPCPDHGRQPGESWSHRDDRAQARFRRAVMARSFGHCERCGGLATVAHHVKPGYDPESGLALCDECHMAVDDKARSTKKRRGIFHR